MDFVKEDGFLSHPVKFLYFVGIFPQVFFFGIELIEIKEKGFRAFWSNSWNIFDFSQIFIYFGLMIVHNVEFASSDDSFLYQDFVIALF
mmetsp:Transcript_3352/g.5066  ORF Transcript_3352/g.5066 Transcript_3352/m.5066 type:complete len:89 (-) Transcript_3352:842-1108(-)